jgi:hypothetical protein
VDSGLDYAANFSSITQVVTVAAVACIFAVSFVMAVAALLIGESTHWTWIGAGASTAFLVPSGGALAFAYFRDLARRP